VPLLTFQPLGLLIRACCGLRRGQQPLEQFCEEAELLNVAIAGGCTPRCWRVAQSQGETGTLASQPCNPFHECHGHIKTVQLHSLLVQISVHRMDSSQDQTKQHWSVPEELKPLRNIGKGWM
jgi:hypothetical protein